MYFQTGYYNSLDRGYYSSGSIEDNKSAVSGESFSEEDKHVTDLTARDIGTTIDANANPTQALNAKIREGAAKLEFVFLGTGKGGFGGQNATPEIMGKLERQQLRELANINEVKTSTHASIGIQGLSGFNPQSGKLDDDMRQKTLKEINKAIEFAAGATTGGAVVFHTGEWNRPIFEAGVNKKMKENNQKGLFREYDTEENKAQILLADPETGKVQALSRDMKFYFPEMEYDDKTKMSYVKMDSKTNTPIVKEYDFNGAIGFIKKQHKDDGALDGKTDGEILLRGLYEQQLRSAEGDVLRFYRGTEEYKEQLEKTIKAKATYEKIWNSTPESERWKLMEQVGGGKFIPPDTQNPVEYLKKQEQELRSAINSNLSLSISSQEKVEEIKKQMDRYKPIEEVGIIKTAQGIAKAGLKAMEETNRHKKELKESVYVAPESYSPEYYGSHPDEIRKIINSSRDEMKKMLMHKGMSESEANAKAKEHIRGTLDIGHFNLWRQHFQGDPKKFEKWLLDESEKLVKEGLIGHIHLTDNYGYDDEHLTPGQGNVPMKEFMKRMEKLGMKDFIAERGNFNAQTILADTLSEFGSPVHALGPRVNMSQVRHGHFGYNAPPNYIVGAYAPSNEWRLWSEVPLE